MPAISVIVLNYNGAPWLTRCLGSLSAQTIFDRIEVIVADNNSPDGSAALAAELMRDWPNGRVIQHGANLGYCEGNNRAAAQARGEFLFFLNNDTWLEPDCLEILLHTVVDLGATAAAPQILGYDSDTVDTPVATGFDLFGLPSYSWPKRLTSNIFAAGGCSYFIRRHAFENLGGFDPAFFMYADECDLSWRVWLAGGSVISVCGARLHHRGGAAVNPAGGNRMVELRTTAHKRFLANRNCLLLLLKNAQHVIILLVLSQLLLLAVESLVVWALTRRFSFVRQAYINALRDCWRLRKHVLQQRRRIRDLRRRGDWWMLRFLRLRPGRLEELRMIRQLGPPKLISV